MMLHRLIALWKLLRNKNISTELLEKLNTEHPNIYMFKYARGNDERTDQNLNHMWYIENDLFYCDVERSVDGKWSIFICDSLTRHRTIQCAGAAFTDNIPVNDKNPQRWE